MQEINDLDCKINNFTKNFQKDVAKILEEASSKKCKIYSELQMVKFFENLMATNQLLCEMKCKVTQMRYDLSEMKENPKKETAGEKESERDKIIVLLYRCEEHFEGAKKKVLKELKNISDKMNKKKFTMDEVKAWTEISNFIEQITERMNL